MLTRMKKEGRVEACGAVANYNTSSLTGLRNWFEVITNRWEIKGFIFMEFHGAEEGAGGGVGDGQALKERKIKVGDERETLVETKFEDMPKMWMMLFGGIRGSWFNQVRISVMS
ncbi:hypothetical protein ABVK25_009609 [Lepraria finkii]|uniref:Uncharacterized protein n=1 Tax=Lepraria finkii TaxID=1340010 RepID=A0ABR4AZ87_9LECA